MKEYAQLLRHSQFSTVKETAEGAQERRFFIDPVSVSALLHPEKKS